MNDFRGKTITSNLSLSGCRFSPEFIKKLNEEQPRVRVFHKFLGSPIGHTIGFTEYTDDSISVDIHIDNMESLRKAVFPLFAVPNILMRHEEDMVEIDGVRVVKDGRLVGMYLTNYPLDQTLTPIQPIEK